MSGRKTIDKTHPKFGEYIEKCKALWADYEKRTDAEEAKYPDWKPGMGYDHPATGEITKLERQRNAELRKLQEEYSYLFTVDIEEAEDEE